jgi:acetyl-CoA carboxylase carboxyltransferase component
MALHGKLQEYYRRFAQQFRTAEHFGIEDIIDPRETRPCCATGLRQFLIMNAQILESKKEE